MVFYQCHVIRRKRNFLIATDLDDAALAGNDLVEKSTVLEFYRDNLITDPGLFTSIQVIDTSTRNGNQTFHCTPLECRYSGGLDTTPRFSELQGAVNWVAFDHGYSADRGLPTLGHPTPALRNRTGPLVVTGSGASM